MEYDRMPISSDIVHVLYKQDTYIQSVYWYARGHATTLFVFHGMYGNGLRELKRYRILFPDCNIASFDLPSHNYSGGRFMNKIDPENVLRAFAVFVTLAQRETARVICCASSFGAVCVLYGAMHAHAEDIAHITFVFFAPAVFITSITPLQHMSLRLLCAIGLGNLLVNAHEDLHDDAYTIAELYRRSFQYTHDAQHASLQFVLDTYTLSRCVAERIPNIARCVCVMSRHDTYIDVAKTAAYFADARVVWLENTSHSLLYNRHTDIDILRKVIT